MSDSKHLTSTSDGFKSYLSAVYRFMVGGLVVSGLVAYFIAHNPKIYLTIATTPLLEWTIYLAPLVLVLVFAARIHTMTASGAQAMFWIYSLLMGLSLSSIFISYSGSDITSVFFIAALMFAVLSIIGTRTQRDLSGLGGFLFVTLIGLLIVMLFNLFFANETVSLLVNVVGVFLFAGLTAFDTQRIQAAYSLVAGDEEKARKAAIMGALTLYLDFINMFLFLLQLFGGGRR